MKENKQAHNNVCTALPVRKGALLSSCGIPSRITCNQVILTVHPKKEQEKNKQADKKKDYDDGTTSCSAHTSPVLQSGASAPTSGGDGKICDGDCDVVATLIVEAVDVVEANVVGGTPSNSVHST